MNVPLWVAVPVTVLVALAARADVRNRTIPNRITFPALLLGVAVHTAMSGVPGLTTAMAGLAVAGGVLLPGYLLGWMGAGDVKLMAAVGAWIGWPLALTAVLASLVAGGILALAVAVRRGVLRRALTGAAWIAHSVLARTGAPVPETTGIRFPFALAVLAGSIITFWLPA